MPTQRCKRQPARVFSFSSHLYSITTAAASTELQRTSDNAATGCSATGSTSSAHAEQGLDTRAAPTEGRRTVRQSG